MENLLGEIDKSDEENSSEEKTTNDGVNDFEYVKYPINMKETYVRNKRLHGILEKQREKNHWVEKKASQFH